MQAETPPIANCQVNAESRKAAPYLMHPARYAGLMRLWKEHGKQATSVPVEPGACRFSPGGHPIFFSIQLEKSSVQCDSPADEFRPNTTKTESPQVITGISNPSPPVKPYAWRFPDRSAPCKCTSSITTA